MSNKIEMADVCELADTLTKRECEAKQIAFEQGGAEEGLEYTEESQKIFDYYYNIICNTLGV